MWEIFSGVIKESAYLFRDMSPYLLFGFLVAGLLHVFVSLNYVAEHLGKGNVFSVIKAVVLGIPLPLCSCGVIPAAVTLKKKGASKGSVISFLIATPITGVDSILATYSLLGPLFTIYRIVAASCTALITGVLTNWWLPHRHHVHAEGIEHDPECPTCREEKEEKHSCCEDESKGYFREYFRYTFFELIGDIWKWLLLGTLIGGAIAYAIPENFIEQHLSSGWLAMLLMLAIGIPMYVCATGSIPIAAALMLKGMSPGAALVFLLAGPATNAITITVVSKELGKGAAAIYVFCIAIMSILFGMLFNDIWNRFNLLAPEILKPMKMLPAGVEIGAAIILASLIVFVAIHEIIKGLRDRRDREKQ